MSWIYNTKTGQWQQQGVNVPAPPTPPVAQTPTTYGSVQGFDTGKINNPGHVNDKYTAALRAFAGGLGSGVQIGRSNLQGMVDYAKRNGFPNAKAVGDDHIDYGDGKGPIDVIQSNGSVWFQNGPDRLGGNQAAPTPTTPTPAPAVPTPAPTPAPAPPHAAVPRPPATPAAAATSSEDIVNQALRRVLLTNG